MKTISPELLDSLGKPTQYDPKISVLIYDIDGTTFLGELNTQSGTCSSHDGDLAGPASIVVFDPGRIAKEWCVVRVLAGYGTETIPIYRGRIRGVEEDIPVPGATTITCVEGIADLFERPIITALYNADESGADGLHTGEWLRSEIAVDIARRVGIIAGTVEATIKEVEQPPYVNETVADAIAKTLMPEFMKARIDEDGNLRIFKARLTGTPDHTFTEGQNLVDMAPVSFRIEPMITEVLVEGASGEEVQVAYPPRSFHEEAFSVDPLESNILRVFEMPQAKVADTLQHEICLDEVDFYNQESFQQGFSGQGSFCIVKTFEASGRQLWAVKDVTLNEISCTGDPAPFFNRWYRAELFYADGSRQTLFDTFSNPNIGVTNVVLAKPLMGIIVSGRVSNPSDSPRTWGVNIDLVFTRMTEREMYQAGVLKTDFGATGGGSLLSAYNHVDCAYGFYSYGPKLPGTVSSTKDLAETDEFNYGLRTTSTWEFDTLQATLSIFGQIWGTGRAQVLIFKQVDTALEDLFGKRQLYVQNPSIADETEAQAIADVLTVPLTTSRGQGIAEFSWTAPGWPHAEPGDLATLAVTDDILLDMFPSFPLVYIQSVTHSWDVDDTGSLQYMTGFNGIQSEQAGISVFKNLSVDVVKARADIQSLYLTSLIKVRIVSVNDSSQAGTISSVLPRTDGNTYNVELLSEPGTILKNVPNAFPEAYLESDVALLQFQQGNRSFPWLVGRPHATFAESGDDTRPVGDGPPAPESPCMYITNETLPDGTVGAFYEVFLNSASGQFGESWAWESAFGTLDGGLQIEDSGVFKPTRQGRIFGTPVAPGTNRIGIRTKDDRGNIAIKSFYLTVNAP